MTTDKAARKRSRSISLTRFLATSSRVEIEAGPLTSLVRLRFQRTGPTPPADLGVNKFRGWRSLRHHSPRRGDCVHRALAAADATCWTAIGRARLAVDPRGAASRGRPTLP